MQRTIALLVGLLIAGVVVAGCGTPTSDTATAPVELIEPENTAQSADDAQANAADVDPATSEEGLGILNSDLPAQAIAATNERRAAVGCPALTPNPQLAVAAQRHAEDMAVRDYLNHTNPEGLAFFQRISETGYAWLKSGENIAAGTADANATVAQWEASPAHRDAMFDCTYTEVGIGYAFQENDQNNVVLPDGSRNGPFFHYWVMTLGQPAP